MYLMTSTNRMVALRGATGSQAGTGCIRATSSTWTPLAGDGQEPAK